MIKGHGRFGEQPFLLIGLSQGNIDKLLEGQPIVFNAREVGPDLPPISVIVTAGATEEAILADVQEAFGKITEVRWE